MRAIGSASTSHSLSNITRRQDNQLRRIQNGVGDGSLTADEAGGLMSKQAQIAEAKGRAMADGSIDAGERKQLRRMQRGASRDIFEQRHNGSESPVASGQRASCIDSHQARQAGRIQRGIADGSLTACETGSLMGQQTRLAEAEGRAMADGTMDAAEYGQLRQLQREASLSIFNARHNDGIRV